MIPVGQRVLAKFTAAPLLQLSTWIEANISLPEGTSASPGPMRLWPWQHEIADAISDPKIERVTLLKASRIGFTALTIGAIGAYVVNEPASILVLYRRTATAVILSSLTSSRRLPPRRHCAELCRLIGRKAFVIPSPRVALPAGA
jgi:phage terminase large subunit GpA-like protein